MRLGEVESIEHTRDRGLSLTVYFGKRKGSASTADLNPDSIEKTIEHACAIARHTEEDPCNGLADADLLAHEFPDLDLWHPWDITTEEATELALRCEAAGRSLRSAHQQFRRRHRAGRLVARGRCHFARILLARARYPAHDFGGPARRGRSPACSATTGTNRCAAPMISRMSNRSDARPPSARSPASARASSARGSARCCSRRRSRAA